MVEVRTEFKKKKKKKSSNFCPAEEFTSVSYFSWDFYCQRNRWILEENVLI